MRVTHKQTPTIAIDVVLKHPENYTIIGMIKFNSSNYLYKLTRLSHFQFVWANLLKVGCLNKCNDDNDAQIFQTTEAALNKFMNGNEQHELHVFNRKEDLTAFILAHL